MNNNIFEIYNFELKKVNNKRLKEYDLFIKEKEAISFLKKEVLELATDNCLTFEIYNKTKKYFNEKELKFLKDALIKNIDDSIKSNINFIELAKDRIKTLEKEQEDLLIFKNLVLDNLK